MYSSEMQSTAPQMLIPRAEKIWAMPLHYLASHASKRYMGFVIADLLLRYDFTQISMCVQCTLNSLYNLSGCDIFHTKYSFQPKLLLSSCLAHLL